MNSAIKIKGIGWRHLISIIAPPIFLVIALFGVIEPAIAQFPGGTTKSKEAAAEKAASEIWTQKQFEASQRMLKLILEKFQPVFPSEHQYLLSNDRVTIDMLSDFNAFADYKHKRVIIPFRLIVEADAQVRGFLMVRNKRSLAPEYKTYMKYLAERSYTVRLRVLKGETKTDDIPLLQFWMFTKEPPANLTNAEMLLYTSVMMEGLALVVAHELGHLVLNHSDKVSASDSRKQEIEADNFGAKLVREAGFKVAPSLITYYYRFVLNEELVKGTPLEAHTHPRAHCRIYYIGKDELLDLTDSTKSPEARKEFEELTNMTIEQFEESINALRENCRLMDKA